MPISINVVKDNEVGNIDSGIVNLSKFNPDILAKSKSLKIIVILFNFILKIANLSKKLPILVDMAEKNEMIDRSVIESISGWIINLSRPNSKILAKS